MMLWLDEHTTLPCLDRRIKYLCRLLARMSGQGSPRRLPRASERGQAILDRHDVDDVLHTTCTLGREGRRKVERDR